MRDYNKIIHMGTESYAKRATRRSGIDGEDKIKQILGAHPDITVMPDIIIPFSGGFAQSCHQLDFV